MKLTEKSLILIIIATITFLVFMFPLRPLTWGSWFSKCGYPVGISESTLWEEFKARVPYRLDVPKEVRAFIERDLWLLNIKASVFSISSGENHYFIELLDRERNDAVRIYVFDKKWKFLRCYARSMA